MADWARNLRTALAERGLRPERVAELVDEAIEIAAAHDRAPSEVFGPATAYADELARALRSGPATRLAARGDALPALRLTDVAKRYGRRRALSPVSLTVGRGEAVAVVGANGSGKSTLVAICAGLLRPSTGTVERVERVGLVPQSGGTADFLSAAEQFELFGAAERMAPARAVAVGAGLAAALGWRPRRQPANQLSGGTRQKLNVVLGELHRPDLLLLDEPYQGFDIGAYVDLWEQIDRWREAGTAVLLVTHLLGELHRVDRVVELDSPVEA